LRQKCTEFDQIVIINTNNIKVIKRRDAVRRKEALAEREAKLPPAPLSPLIKGELEEKG